MRLKQLGSNQTVLETSKARVLFSYETPVAAYVYGRGYVRSENYYSVTTSKHINKFVDDTAEKVPQAFLDSLLSEREGNSNVQA